MILSVLFVLLLLFNLLVLPRMDGIGWFSDSVRSRLQKPGPVRHTDTGYPAKTASCTHQRHWDNSTPPAEIMHLPEFTVVGMLGFARWMEGQYGSDSGAAQWLGPGTLQPPVAHHQAWNGRAAPKPYTTDRPSDTGGNLPCGPLTGTANHWPAQRHLWWRQPARWSTPATRQARALAPAAQHGQKHCINPRPARLGCTALLPLPPQHQD